MPTQRINHTYLDIDIGKKPSKCDLCEMINTVAIAYVFDQSVGKGYKLTLYTSNHHRISQKIECNLMLFVIHKSHISLVSFPSTIMINAAVSVYVAFPTFNMYYSDHDKGLMHI